jgi:hypothetical protein
MIAILISDKTYINYFRLFAAVYAVGFLDTLLDGELTNIYGVYHSIGYGLGLFLVVLFLFGFVQLANRIVTGKWFTEKYEKMWLVTLVFVGFWLLARIVSFIFPEYSNQIVL